MAVGDNKSLLVLVMAWCQTGCDELLTERVTQATEWDSSYIDGLVQERRNSIADAMELRLSCTNPSIWVLNLVITASVADLTLHGAQPSAATVLTTKMDMFYSESRWLWLPFRHRVTSFKMAEEILGNLPALWVLKPTKSTVEPCIPYHNQSLLHTRIIIVFKTCFVCHIIMLGKRGLNSLGKWSRNNSFSYYPGLSIISPIHCSLWRVSLCGSRAPCGMSQHWSLGSPICCQTYISPLEWDLVNSPSKLRHASCRWTGISLMLLHLQIPTFNDITNWNTNNHFQLSSMKFIVHLQYVFIVDFSGGVAGMYVITSGDHHYRPLPAYCGQWVVLMANWPPRLFVHRSQHATTALLRPSGGGQVCYRAHICHQA